MTLRPAAVLVASVSWAALALTVWARSSAEGDNLAAVAEDPQQIMVAMSTRLFAALDRERAAIRRDPQRVLPVVDELLAPHFDAQYTARLVLGTHWRGASAEQQQRFAVALYQTLLRTYAEAIAEWTPDRFKILPSHADPAALQVVIRSEVIQRSGTLVRVDYRLRSTTSGWKVFDVLVDGVSYAHSYHDDLDTEVSQKGLDAAIVRLERSAPTAPQKRPPQGN